MIRWSFWVDAWEHPFNTWNRFYSVLIPLGSVEPSLGAIDPLPPKEHVDFGPWKGPPPGPIKPGVPKIFSPTNGHRDLVPWMTDIFGQRIMEPQYGPEQQERDRPPPAYEYDRPRNEEREFDEHPEHPWQDMNYGP